MEEGKKNIFVATAGIELCSSLNRMKEVVKIYRVMFVRVCNHYTTRP